jgi:heavy metal translocating P-type ATPase
MPTPKPSPATTATELRLRKLLRPAAAFGFLLAGLFALLIAGARPAHLIWTVGLYLVGFPIVLRTAWGVLRGRLAADLVAALAIGTAALLAEPAAGLVVALMQSGGELLESMAARRASRAVRDLEAQAPRIAHRLGDTGSEDVPAGALWPGDRVVVRPGEMIPCDGVVESGEAAVDVSRVTGEPLPLHAQPGTAVMSGSLVVDGPLTLRTLRTAHESLYEQIVTAVRTAQASKAPFQRMADRAAVWFTPLTLLVCGAAWIVSREPERVLAVLVVATPCPLILAAPVAFVGGMSRAARRGVVLRHGGAIEALATVDAVLFDKTGTVTAGEPTVTRVCPEPPWKEPELLALAASVEEGAGHPLARSIVSEAGARGLRWRQAAGVRESPGRGVTGSVDGKEVAVGSRSLVSETALVPIVDPACVVEHDGDLHAFITVDRLLAGVIGFRDVPRPGIHAALNELRALGITRLALVSGDHQPTVRSVAAATGFDDVAGDLLPQEKAARVNALRRQGHRVLMVGDGINDAPALSAATVGLAMARNAGGIAAEAADVVLLHPEPRRIPESIRLARATVRIARQSVLIGLSLSGVAMLIAAAGYIPPITGALLQEAIDLAVILNALRAAAD